MDEAASIIELQQEIRRLLAEAVRAEERHRADLARRDHAQADDDERRVEELFAKDVLHSEQIANLRAAIESRDVIGQAKGVIMVSMGCDANEAFELLIRQSQHENRKLIDVATEIASRAGRPRPTSVDPQAQRP